MRKSAELPIEGIPLCCCLWDCEFGKISLSLRFSSGSIICNGKIRKKNGISRLRRLKDGQMEPYWNKLCLMCSWAEIGSFLLIKVHSIITKKKIFGLIPKSSTQKNYRRVKLKKTPLQVVILLKSPWYMGSGRQEQTDFNMLFSLLTKAGLRQFDYEGVRKRWGLFKPSSNFLSVFVFE